MLRFCPRRPGSVLVLAAALMVVMFAFLAFAIDIGYLCLTRTQLQSAADAGALAGALALSSGPEAVREATRDFAEANVAAGSAVVIEPDEDIQLGLWDDQSRTFQVLAPGDEADANAVRVFCRRNETRGGAANLLFGRLLGLGRADVIASAIACAEVSICGQIIGLNRVTMSGSSYTDSYNATLGNYSAGSASNRGHVCSNGPIIMSGYTQIKGNAHPGPASTVMGTANVTGSIQPLDSPLSFPPVSSGTAATENDNGNIPTSAFGLDPLSPTGAFGLSLGDSVELPPGGYYFTRMTLTGGSSITLSGPTVIYVTGDCSLSGGSVVNSTLSPSNLQLYCSGTLCSLSGEAEFHGVVYAPTARVTRSGDTDYYGMILGREITLSGTGGIHADESLNMLQGAANRPVLVQ